MKRLLTEEVSEKIFIKKMKRLLTEEESEIFLDGMSELTCNGCRNPFIKMAEVLPFNSRQLCNYWRNYLDPEVHQGSLSDEEKQFIDEWIKLNRIENGVITWKTLRHELKNQFGFLRSENAVKNYWYSKQNRTGAVEESESLVLPQIPYPTDPEMPIPIQQPNPIALSTLQPYCKHEDPKLPDYKAVDTPDYKVATQLP
ncbi:hypothetical protein C1645_743336 [Glomus cerebriforme]|uniref:HTH myb-type domain-containing protein n=1 Tax=Glomus cerebriforme TaxID=658196 RepID=A0A397SAQ3_9GLOM|nr:hypothetical protein C1645_743336 [Glomus cerebriforme]